MSTSAFERELSAALHGELDCSLSARALFSSDASNYRIVPLGVAYPTDEHDVLAILTIARAHGHSVISRGGGTSTGGQTVGAGLIMDCSRYLDRVLSLDPVARTARVQPGAVLDTLQLAAAPHGLRFGPDPSTHDRCTLGGMIGNNACGAHSMRWGKTDDNVLSLRVALVTGETLELSTMEALRGDRSPGASELAARLDEFLSRYERTIRDDMGPDFSRRVSGYGLQHLLPERGGNIARALVGTEGTCVAVLEATVRLVEPPPSRVLLLLGFSDHYVAADFVPTLLEFAPLTIEGLDVRLVDLARHTNENGAGVALLPEGNGWLLLEIGGETISAAHARAEEIVSAIGFFGRAAILDDHAMQRSVWRLREDGAGLATRLPDGSEAWPGWEDAAVPPEHLGAYLRRFDELLAAHGRQGMLFGHFGEGCMHVRIDFDLLSSEGRANFRHFIEAAADLVVSFGGSLSGEHGDGQARGELLGRMYPPSIIEAFAAFKAVFDPENRLNPGNIIDPRPLDENLRVRIPVRKIEDRSHLALHADHGDLEVGARRCVGVGKCRRLDGGAMCPSFQVTRNERDSTRGRARLLSEMFGGDLISKGWRSREVLDALDLCLGCKACASDCPVGVDVARYKVEFLSHYYEHHLRPRAHYALGQLPAILRSSHRFAAIANLLIHSSLAPLLKWLGGIDQRRSLPQLATRTLQDLDRPEPKGPTVILWPDTFSNYLAPEVGEAAIEVLEHLGATVALPRDPLCCGLTWFSTGQIEEARKVVASSLLSLLAMGTDDVPIVVLEPSCAAMLREELSELFPGEVRAAAIAQRIRSFGELVVELIQDGATLELSQSNRRYLAQVHCHQRATVGYSPENELLSLLSVLPIDLEESCCGLAGNFGFEAGHYEISQKIAERGILHRIHRAFDELHAEPPVVVADGFSCRTQIEELSGVTPQHLAEILRDAIRLGGTVASDANVRNGG